MSSQHSDHFIDEGVDPLALLTPLVERRRLIILGTLLVALVVGLIAVFSARKYKAELALTPVTNNKSGTSLGGIAALAGASLQTGYTLTPTRMVELLKSRRVLSGVGMSLIRPNGAERVIDRIDGEKYTNNDMEEVAKRILRMLDVAANKETGTITVAIQYPDSMLTRIIAMRVVDSASQIFVRTSKAQAQQQRIAQEGRVVAAKQQLEAAEDKLREFNFSNRATLGFSTTSVDRTRLSRDIQFAEQVYTQAVTDKEAAYARELEATPTVVIQDPIPDVLPKVRKRIVVKTSVAGLVTLVLLSLGVLIVDLTRRRLVRSDAESDRFRRAVATLPRLRRSAGR